MECSALQLISTQRATGPLLEGLRRPQRPDVRRWNHALGAHPGERETPRRLAQALRQRLVDVHARRRDRDFAAAVRSPVSHHGLVRGGAVPQLAEGAGFELHTCLMRRISAMRRSDGVSLGGALLGPRVCVFCTAVLRGPPAAVTSQLVVGRQKRTTNSVPRFWELSQDHKVGEHVASVHAY